MGIRHLFARFRRTEIGLTRVLFYRDFRGFAGGHLKVWDYYNHVRAHPGYDAQVCFSPATLWDASNPWWTERRRTLSRWRPERADMLFLAGLDWQQMAGRRVPPTTPVLNLVQHVRHARPDDERYPFLRNRAIRICVSEEVADAIRATGQVNGPVFAIPNGIPMQGFPEPMPWDDRPIDLLIAALKNPHLGEQLQRRFATGNGRTVLLQQHMARQEFLKLLGQSRFSLLLPNATEGFYLPALEAMRLGTLVICPDCVGNRSFCRDGDNSYRPNYTEEAVAAALQDAMQMSSEQRNRLLAAASRTAAEHSLERERTKFWEILRHVADLW